MCCILRPGCSVLIFVFGFAIIAFTESISSHSIIIDRSKDFLEVEREIPTSQAANVSARLPPQGFAFEVYSGGSPLDERKCFAVAISAISDLARQNFYSRLPSAKSYQLPEYPDVALSLTGPGGRGFYVKYMIWGVTTAIKYMVDHNQFTNLHFALMWQGNLVGSVWFIYLTGRESIEGNHTVVSKNLNGLAPSTGFLRAISQNDMSVSFNWLPGDDLSFEEVMMVIIGGFTDLAIFDISQPVSGNRFVAVFPPYRTRFGLHPDARLAPQNLFSYEFVSSVLLTTAQFYIMQQVCKPVFMQVLIDRQAIATGALTKVPLRPFGNERARAANDTISRRTRRRPTVTRAL